MVAPLISMRALSGAAARLWYQAGMLAAPLDADGGLIYREDVHDGLEHAPDTLTAVLSGRNFGKMLVRVGPDPL